MTFRIKYSHEDFSGLATFGFSTSWVEIDYLVLIQPDIYHQRVISASKKYSKLENLRFIFMQYS